MTAGKAAITICMIVMATPAVLQGQRLVLWLLRHDPSLWPVMSPVIVAAEV